MNKLIIKTYTKKVLEFLLYGPGYKAPEYAYVRVNKTPSENMDMYDDRFER